MKRAIGAVLCLSQCAAVALAQSPAPAAPAMSATVPDVQILVAPGPSPSSWLVAAVYPREVPRTAVTNQLGQLVSVSGWSMGAPQFTDKSLDPTKPSGTENNPRMSSVSFQATGNLVDYRDGTLALEPFIRAYRDLNRLNVTFLVPGQFNFQGLRSYSDKNIALMLSGEQGAFTYVVNIKNHQLDVLNLPKRQADVVATAPQEARRPRVAGWVIPSLVVLAALVAAGVAYVVTHRFMNR